MFDIKQTTPQQGQVSNRGKPSDQFLDLLIWMSSITVYKSVFTRVPHRARTFPEFAFFNNLQWLPGKQLC